MNGTMVTLVGQVASEVRYTTTVGGVPVASFRLVATDRRYDRQRQSWVDGDSSAFTVWCWRWLAENVLSSVGRGDPLLVTGRMRVREWDNGPDKPVGLSAEIEAAAVGHDLSRGTSAFRRAVRGRPELVARASERAAPGASEARTREGQESREEGVPEARETAGRPVASRSAQATEPAAAEPADAPPRAEVREAAAAGSARVDAALLP